MPTSSAQAAAGQQTDMSVLATLTPESLAACPTRELRDATPDDVAIPPRDEAVAIFRRHLGRHHASIRKRFERFERQGDAAAQRELQSVV